VYRRDEVNSCWVNIGRSLAAALKIPRFRFLYFMVSTDILRGRKFPQGPEIESKRQYSLFHNFGENVKTVRDSNLADGVCVREYLWLGYESSLITLKNERKRRIARVGRCAKIKLRLKTPFISITPDANSQ